MPRNSQLCVGVLLHLEWPSLFLLITSLFLSLYFHSLFSFFIHPSQTLPPPPFVLYFLDVCTFTFFSLVPSPLFQANLYFFIRLWWIKVSYSHSGVEDQPWGREALAYIFQRKTAWAPVTPAAEKDRQGCNWPWTLCDHLLWIFLFTKLHLLNWPK